MRRIGLYGGTFDPIHDGHLELARGAAKEFRLDKVLCIPAALPPHKRDSRISSFYHRARMIELALAGEPSVELSTIEAELPVPSYTIDTVRAFRERMGDVELYFLIGGDAFLELHSWKSYRELLRSVTLVVAQRAGFSHASLTRIRDKLGYLDAGSSWVSQDGECEILFMTTAIPDVSSSVIRNRLFDGEREVDGIPKEVMGYIKNNTLYQP